MAISATTVDVILSHFSQISVKNKTKIENTLLSLQKKKKRKNL
jgi:hypothetical protein